MVQHAWLTFRGTGELGRTPRAFRTLLIALVLAWGVPQSVWAVARCVDQADGGCVGSGSFAVCPVNYCTIQAAIDDSVNGDVITVAPGGTYVENLILAKSLTLNGAQMGIPAGTGAVVPCNRTATESTIAPAAGIGLDLQTGAAGSIIDGFTFSGGARAIESNTGSINDLQILNNRVIGFTGNGIFLDDNGIDITVDDNLIDGSSKTGSGGLFHLDTDNFDGFHFTDNCVLNGNTVGTATGFFVDGNHNVGVSANRAPLFSGNRISANTTGTNLGSRAFEFGTISSNTFSNNTFDGLQGGIQNSSITGNLFQANGRHGLSLTSFGNVAVDRGGQNDTITLNCFTGNGFVNAGAGIFFSATQAPGTIATNIANTNNIEGNASGFVYTGSEVINGTSNYWGCPTGANTGGCDTASPSVVTVPFSPTQVPGTPCQPPPPTTTTTTSSTTSTTETTTTSTTSSTAPPATTSTTSSTALTTTTSSTTLPPNDHFKCYRTRSDRFTQRSVTLVDQFTSSTARVIRPDRLCNPADKNGEGIEDPTRHLMCYRIREGAFVRREVLVRNQFGDQTLTVVKPESLCNPADKDGVPRLTDGNHFKCYRVRGRGFTTRTVNVADQFETQMTTLVKPRLLCNPVDKNGEGIADPAAHLACYTIKASPPPLTPRDVTVMDQFAEEDFQALRGQCHRRSVLCVPSEKNPTSPSGAFLEPTPALF